MKHSFVILFVFLTLFSSCHKNPQERAEHLVKNWVRENVADLKSYEPIMISPIDSAFSSLENNELFKHYDEMFTQLQEECEILHTLADALKPFAYFDANAKAEMLNYAMQMKINGAKMGEYADSVRILESSFVPEFLGFNLSHKFRAKNEDGILTIYNYLFCFDKDITEILAAIPYKE